MALRVKCKCGKVLKVPSTLAGKKFVCPGCKKFYRIAPEKFATETTSPPPKPARAPAPRVAVAAATRTTPNNLSALDLDAAIADLSGTIEPSSDDLLSGMELTSLPLPTVPRADVVEVAYAADPTARVQTARRQALLATEGPKGSYWIEALGAFYYPAANLNNAITVTIILAMALIRDFLGLLGLFGLLGAFIIRGWIVAIYLSVIQDTAAGSADLPGFKLVDGFYEDIIQPLFRFIGAFAVAFAPSAILSILLVLKVLPEGAGRFSLPCLVLCIFLLPMFLMLFAFGAVGMIIRVDLIVMTIIRTFLPYLAMWLMLLVVGFVYFLTLSSPMLAKLGFSQAASWGIGMGAAWAAFVSCAQVYLIIVSMRIIGLYYLHFKRRFAIVME